MRIQMMWLVAALAFLTGCPTMLRAQESYCGLSPLLRCEVENLIEFTSNQKLDSAGFPVAINVGAVCPDGLVCPSTFQRDAEAGDWQVLDTAPAETAAGKELGAK